MGLKLKTRPDVRRPVVADLKIGDIGVIMDTEHPWFGQPFITSKHVIVNLNNGESHLFKDDTNYAAKQVEPGSTLQVEPCPDETRKTLVDNDKLVELIAEQAMWNWLNKQSDITIQINKSNASLKFYDEDENKMLFRKSLKEVVEAAINAQKGNKEPVAKFDKDNPSVDTCLEWLQHQPQASLESNSAGTMWTIRLLSPDIKNYHFIQPWSPTIKSALQSAYKEYAHRTPPLKKNGWTETLKDQVNSVPQHMMGHSASQIPVVHAKPLLGLERPLVPENVVIEDKTIELVPEDKTELEVVVTEVTDQQQVEATKEPELVGTEHS